MTQASDLGGIANQLAAFYRARVNVNLQALATQHYGASEPPVMYPNMIWFCSGDGYIKVRNPSNPNYSTTSTIISKLAALAPNTVVWGYIDIGVNPPASNHSLASLQTQIDQWLAIGAM